MLKAVIMALRAVYGVIKGHDLSGLFVDKKESDTNIPWNLTVSALPGAPFTRRDGILGSC
jgi:hypothetical protein